MRSHRSLLIAAAVVATAFAVVARAAETPATGTTREAAAASGRTEEELARDFIDATNADRVRHGLAPLFADRCLDAAASQWGHRLAAMHRLAHRSEMGLDMPAEVDAHCPGTFKRIGENLGHGATVDGLQSAFMDSLAHRGNVLDPSFTHVGVDVTHRAGDPDRMLVVVQFGAARFD